MFSCLYTWIGFSFVLAEQGREGRVDLHQTTFTNSIFYSQLLASAKYVRALPK